MGLEFELLSYQLPDGTVVPPPVVEPAAPDGGADSVGAGEDVAGGVAVGGVAGGGASAGQPANRDADKTVIATRDIPRANFIVIAFPEN